MTSPIYLDNHATTPIDPGVLEAMMPYFRESFGNAASRQHVYGWVAEEAVERARKVLAENIGAEPREVIFTSGATESNNLALKGVAENYRNKGNHIITVATEHRSVLDVCASLERSGYRVTILPVDEYGSVAPADVSAAITGETILVSVMMANNEVGTIAPIAEIGAICRERGVLLHSDASQYLGKASINVSELNADLLSLSGHKVYGPKGIGALYVRSRNPRVSLAPQIEGGGHENGLRSGTLNVPAIVGFARAVELAAGVMASESLRERGMRDALAEELLHVQGAHVNGHPSARLANNLSITFPYVPAEDLILALRKVVAVSSGSACSSRDQASGKTSHVLKALGLSDEDARCTIRIGLGKFTTNEEIQRAGTYIVENARIVQQASPRYQMAQRSVIAMPSILTL